jgi:RND family efflux transporter MFP subunit
MASTADDLRRNLQALRLERGTPPPRRRRLGRTVLVVAAVVAALVVVTRLSRGRPVPVDVASVTVLEPAAGAADVPVLSGAGYVVSADRYISIGVRVAGRIERYLVEEGDHVLAGDPLVEIDSRDYAAAVTHAEAVLAEARANLTLGQLQLKRMEELARTGTASKSELDVQQASTAAAAATTARAEADLAAAKVSLEYTILRAPRSGVILAKLKEVGEIAVPGGFSGSGDLIRMANLTDLRGQVDVTEGELAKVQMGQRAEVVPDAYPDLRYTAHVVKLYPQVDRQKGTLRVEVQIEHPDDHLWPDMSVRVTFLTPVAVSPGGRAILVPRSAIREDGDQRWAWVVRDARARRVDVTPGQDFGDQRQVTAGLSPGDRVVVGTPPPLRDGQAVAAP